eukprot:TRINITY_DN5640_c0_g1_i1.p1 TRINITY_DN5640_c0_g1~~TRINITY_DN5640_c0_g1_i1.p1  ORF type:complete len:163 (-),score=16.94 TRINITY_DN5640_c0_g1_i1:250-738(-)
MPLLSWFGLACTLCLQGSGYRLRMTSSECEPFTKVYIRRKDNDKFLCLDSDNKVVGFYATCQNQKGLMVYDNEGSQRSQRILSSDCTSCVYIEEVNRSLGVADVDSDSKECASFEAIQAKDTFALKLKKDVTTSHYLHYDDSGVLKLSSEAKYSFMSFENNR